MTDNQEARLRNARDQLIARYDTGAISPAVFLGGQKTRNGNCLAATPRCGDWEEKGGADC
jgi:hypothetical protein